MARFSFYCGHCGNHLASGDHRKCKKILQAARLAKESLRLSQGRATQKRYASGKVGSFLSYCDE